MPFSEILRPPCFSAQLKDICKKFSKSQSRINKLIESIKNNPFQGDRIPGIMQSHLRKLRIPLKEYNIGKSGGLRVVYLLDEDQQWVLMVAVYFKGDYKSEEAVTNMIRRNLREIKSP